MDGKQETAHPTDLKRALSVTDLTVYGLVFITPIAPLSTFGIVFNAAHGMVALVYGVGLVAMVFTALSYMTMSETFPVAGSVYAYATHGLGPRWGLLAGWLLLLDYLLIPALIYVVCAIALAQVWPDVPKGVWIAAILGVNTAINLVGIESTARSGLILLILQLLLLAAFFCLAILAFSHGAGGAHWSLDPLFNRNQFSPGIIFTALSLAAVSFLGFDGISTLAEESRGHARIVGRATLLSLLIAAVLFIAQTYVAALFVPGRTSFPPGAATDAAFYGIAELVGGRGFKWAASVLGVLLAGASGALAAQAATARLIFGMARDGRLPRGLGRLNARHAPRRAIILIAALTLAVGVALVDRLELIASMVNFGALSGFIMLHISVLTYHGWRRRSRDWFRHVASPLIGIAILGYVLFQAEPQAKIAGVVWLALGTLLYLAPKAARRLGLVQPVAGQP